MVKRVQPPEDLPVIAEKQHLRVKQAAHKDAFENALHQSRQQRSVNLNAELGANLKANTNASHRNTASNRALGQPESSTQQRDQNARSDHANKRTTDSTSASQQTLNKTNEKSSDRSTDTDDNIAHGLLLNLAALSTQVTDTPQALSSVATRILNQSLFDQLLRQLQTQSATAGNIFTIDLDASSTGCSQIVAERDSAGQWHIRLKRETTNSPLGMAAQSYEAAQSNDASLSMENISAQSLSNALDLALQHTSIVVASVSVDDRSSVALSESQGLT